MLADPALHLSADEDHAALYAACEPGTALCTIVGIEGSFSRRVGAQLAIRADGSTVGSLSDGCLEAQLATDVSALHSPEVVRYGRGSPKIDFRLPCGGGLDILLDPAPDRNAIHAAVDALEQRDPASLVLPAASPLARRTYIPRMQLNVLGEGPELAAVTLQGYGVAAAPSMSGRDLLKDPHLGARGVWQEVEHPIMGVQLVPGPPWRLSETPATIRSPGPLLGQQNHWTLVELLGEPPEQVEKWVEQGIVY